MPVAAVADLGYDRFSSQEAALIASQLAAADLNLAGVMRTRPTRAGQCSVAALHADFRRWPFALRYRYALIRSQRWPGDERSPCDKHRER